MAAPAYLFRPISPAIVDLSNAYTDILKPIAERIIPTAHQIDSLQDILETDPPARGISFLNRKHEIIIFVDNNNETHCFLVNSKSHEKNEDGTSGSMRIREIPTNFDLNSEVSTNSEDYPLRFKFAAESAKILQLKNEHKIHHKLDEESKTLLLEQPNGSFCAIICEFIPGKDLVECSRDFSLLGTLNVLHKAADQLAILEKNGIRHGDVKPENILTNNGKENGDVKIIDYGMSDDFSGTCMTTNHGGTLEYAAPEILTAKPNDLIDGIRADICSFGILTSYLVANSKMWDERTAAYQTADSIVSLKGILNRPEILFITSQNKLIRKTIHEFADRRKDADCISAEEDLQGPLIDLNNFIYDATRTNPADRISTFDVASRRIGEVEARLRTVYDTKKSQKAPGAAGIFGRATAAAPLTKASLFADEIGSEKEVEAADPITKEGSAFTDKTSTSSSRKETESSKSDSLKVMRTITA